MSTLAREIGKKGPFESPEQEAYLNLVRTAAVLGVPFDRLFKQHGLRVSTYNVLRIVAAGGEHGRTCREIGCDLITPVPDVTRLVDRVETLGLVRRVREEHDRRVVRVRLTPKGRSLLERVTPALMDLHLSVLAHMSQQDIREMSRLLSIARLGGEDQDTTGSPG